VIAKGYFKTPVVIIDHMVEKLFENQIPKATDSVLDTGCGPGDFIEGIIRWCEKHDSPLPNIKGVELDPKFVARAKKKFQKNPEIAIEQRDYLASNNEKFDFIISNPPYVPITQLSENEKRLYRPLYKTAKGRFDLYILFFEKSLKSLSKNGRLVFITPEKYTYIKTAQPLRQLLTDMQVKEIEFLQEDTFLGLTTYPTITIVENSVPQNKVKITYKDSTVKYVSLPKKGESWLPILNGIKNKKSKQTLEDICIKISCGVATGADKIFVQKIDSMDPNLEKYAYPTIAGKELVYDQDLPDIKFKMIVPYDENGKLIPLNKLGPLEKYLKKPEIMKRLRERSCARKKPWHAFHETPPMKFLFRPKILCRDISARPTFWLDKDGIFLPRHTTYYIILKDNSKIYKIFEYLQSKEAQNWLMKNCQRAANNFLRLQSHVLKKLPIPDELYI